MTLTVKLPEDLARGFEIHCKRHRLTKPKVVTRRLARYLTLQARKQTLRQIHAEVGVLKGFESPPDLLPACAK